MVQNSKEGKEIFLFRPKIVDWGTWKVTYKSSLRITDVKMLTSSHNSVKIIPRAKTRIILKQNAKLHRILNFLYHNPHFCYNSPTTKLNEIKYR